MWNLVRKHRNTAARAFRLIRNRKIRDRGRFQPRRPLYSEQLEARYLLASISGEVFFDVNSNSQFDAIDRPITDWRVFLDANANGAYDNGEPSTVADSQGHYMLAGLSAGQHTVVEQPTSGWSPLAPSGGRATLTLADNDHATINFGNIVSGLIHHWPFDEASGTVAADAIGGNSTSLVNWGVDEASWQQGFVNGALNFSGDNNYVITVNPIDSLDQFTVAFWSKMNHRSFNDQVILTPQGHNWIGKDSGGIGIGDVHDSRAPMKQIWEHYVIAMDRVGGSATVYRDGVEVASGLTSLAALNQKWVFGHNQDLGNDSSSWHGLLDDVRLFDRILQQPEAEILAYRPPQPGIVSVLAVPATDFGFQPTGKYDTQQITLNIDPTTIDWLAWNRFPDLRAMELSRGEELLLGTHEIEVDDSFVLTVRNPLGQFLAVELDQNGVMGAPLGPQAVIYGSAAQTPDVLRGDNFQDPNLFNEAGTHNSLFTVAGDYEFTFEFSSIGSLASYPNVWLLMQQEACIQGALWHDLDGDGVRESGEPPLQAWQAYVDSDDDGQFDAGEPTALTNPDGAYRISGISAGQHIVAGVTPNGWTSTPAGDDGRRTVNVQAAGCVAGVDFGSKRNPIALTPGNILVTKGSLTETDLLIEYTSAGVPVQAIPIPGSEGTSHKVAKDVVVDEQGRAQIFNGFEEVSLTTYDSASATFHDTAVSDWRISQAANHLGDIAAFHNFLFANDHRDGGSDEGVFRFQDGDLSWTKFDLGELSDLTVGLDGFLYVMATSGANSTIRSYFPQTMRLASTVVIPEALHSISVDAAGRFYGLTDAALKRFSATGALLNSTASVVGRSIDIAADGASLLVTSSDHATLVASDFSSHVSFALPNPASGFAFGAFIQPPITHNFAPEASDDAYALDEDTTLQVPAPGLLANDLDENSDPITPTRIAAALHGSVTVNSDGSFDYKPNDDYFGDDSFTYTDRDGTLDSNIATVSITVRPIQDAPRLTAKHPTRNTNEDSPFVRPLHDFINSGPGQTVISDPDPADIVGGIAVTAVEGPGVWDYSLDGVSFTPIGAASVSSALLLHSDASVRFTPNGLNGGTALITFHAWDVTAGTTGQHGDANLNGGLTPYSSTTETLTLNVASVNDAPVLTPTGPILGQTDEDTRFEISPRTFVTTVTDPDTSAVLGGLALTAIEGRGQWFYSVDGTAFAVVGSVSESAALLLRADDFLRYVPDGIDGEVARIEYRAWDVSAGIAGSKTDLSGVASGGSHPFSINSDSATLDVLSVNDPPTSISHNGATVAENVLGSDAGVLTVADVDPGDSHTLEVSDSRFEIVGHQLKLKADQSINFESEPSVSLDVTARDTSGLEIIDSITIHITNVNEAPTSLSLSANTVADNASGANVGILTVADVDAGDPHTFIVSDSRFEVVGNQLKLKSGQSLDFETELSVELQITARDTGGFEISDSFTIHVTDINEAPTSISLSANTVVENVAGANIGELTATDADSGDSQTLFVSDSRFEIVGHQLKLKSGHSLNFETEPSVTLDVTARDTGGLELTISFIVLVTNVNEAPTNLSLSPSTIAENALSANVGVLTVSDEDAGDSHTFVISDNRFEIIGNQFKLKSGLSLDFETELTINVDVTARDADGLEITDSLTIQVTNINEAPTSIALSADTIDENDAGANVGVLTVTDVDIGDSHTFVVSDSRFEIVGHQLKLKSGQSLNFENVQSVTLDVTVSDSGGLEIADSFAIHVANVNEAPTSIVLSANTVAENAVGANVGVLTVTDADSGDPHTFVVSDSRFEIVGDQLKLKPGQSLNFEIQQSVILDVTARDFGDLEFTDSFTIHVTNVNEAPTSISLSATTISENVSGATVDVLTVTDADSGDSHTFAVSDSRFEIFGNQLQLKSVESLDFETEPSITLNIAARDAEGLEFSDSFTIHVTNVNEPPTNITLSSNSVAENASGANVGVLTVSDVDTSDSQTLVVSDSRFEIVGNQLKLKSGQSFDFETEPSVSIDVTTRDAGGLEFANSFTIHVTNVNEAPTSITLSADSVAENASGAIVGVLTVTDADPGDSHTFVVSDSRFEIVDHQLKLKSGQSVNFESEPNVILDVTARDTGGLEIINPITIRVTDVNDAPTSISLSANTVAENASGANAGILAAADVDADDSHTFVVSDSRFEIVGNQLKLKSGQSLDFETEPSVELQITARDAGGLEISDSLTLHVTNINEAPTSIALPAADVVENDSGATIGTLTVFDPDSPESHTFLVSDYRFVVVGATLKLQDGQSLDFEAGGSVTLEITAIDSGSPAQSISKLFTVTVNDLNDPPSAINLSPDTIQENLLGIVVGTLSAIDQDQDQTHIFELSDTRFEIVGTTLKLKTGEFLVAGESSTVSIEVVATDSGTPPQFFTQTVVINVTANPHSWHNLTVKFDTDGDGEVVPLDALRVMNLLNNPTILGVDGRLPQARSATAFFYDVNQDGFCTPNDVLQIINFLNLGGGEGESASPNGHFQARSFLLFSQTSASGFPSVQDATCHEEEATKGCYSGTPSLMAVTQPAETRREGFMSATKDAQDDWLDQILDEIVDDLLDGYGNL